GDWRLRRFLGAFRGRGVSGSSGRSAEHRDSAADPERNGCGKRGRRTAHPLGTGATAGGIAGYVRSLARRTDKRSSNRSGARSHPVGGSVAKSSVGSEIIGVFGKSRIVRR